MYCFAFWIRQISMQWMCLPQKLEHLFQRSKHCSLTCSTSGQLDIKSADSARFYWCGGELWYPLTSFPWFDRGWGHITIWHNLILEPIFKGTVSARFHWCRGEIWYPLTSPRFDRDWGSAGNAIIGHHLILQPIFESTASMRRWIHWCEGEIWNSLAFPWFYGHGCYVTIGHHLILQSIFKRTVSFIGFCSRQ